MKKWLLWACALLVLGTGLSAQENDFAEVLRQVEGLVDLVDIRRPAPNSTVRYANNKVATNIYGSATASWYWPNGKLITNLAQSPSATWYWPNGKIVTVAIGSPNATWYWPNGQIMSLRGSGRTESELSNTPELAAKLLRLAIRNGNLR